MVVAPTQGTVFTCWRNRSAAHVGDVPAGSINRCVPKVGLSSFLRTDGLMCRIIAALLGLEHREEVPLVDGYIAPRSAHVGAMGHGRMRWRSRTTIVAWRHGWPKASKLRGNLSGEGWR